MLSHGCVSGFGAERLRRRQIEVFWKVNHVFWDAQCSRSVCPGFLSNYTKPLASPNDLVSGLCGMVTFVPNGNQNLSSALREWRRARGVVRGPHVATQPVLRGLLPFLEQKTLQRTQEAAFHCPAAPLVKWGKNGHSLPHDRLTKADFGKQRQATCSGLLITHGQAVANAGGVTWTPVDPERGLAMKIRE